MLQMLKQMFHPESRRKTGRRLRDRSGCFRLPTPEQLERKLLLATDVYSVDQIGSPVEGGWVVFVQNAPGDDLYLRQVVGNSTFGFEPSWEFSNQADFETRGSLSNGNRYNDILVTNGEAASASSGTAFETPLVRQVPSVTLDNAIPGTVSGTLLVFDEATQTGPPDADGPTWEFGQGGLAGAIRFVPQYLYDPQDGLSGDGVPLVLFYNDTEATSITLDVRRADDGDVDDVAITITGRAYNDRVIFEAEDGDGRTVLLYTLSADYATSNISYTPAPQSFQVTQGQDITAGMRVVGLGSGSSIAINSPVLSAPSTGNRNEFSATNVSVAAPVSTTSEFYAAGEVIAVDAPLTAANGFRINVADDTGSDVRDRGMLSLSQAAGLSAAGGAATPNLRVNANDADIRLLGNVSATTQSWLFQSATSEVAGTFTTRNELGFSTGSISGGNVDILLSNEQQVVETDTITHQIALDTAVNSLRIAAADSQSEVNRYQPFRYDIVIDEQDDLSLDAVLASGGDVTIEAGDNVQVNANIQSQRDVTLRSAGGSIAGNATLATVSGEIAIEATDVAINGRIAVLAPPVDESLADVSVVATSGGIDIAGGISGVNTVILDQSGVGGISVQDVVAATNLQAFSDEAVTLQTNADVIEIEAEGAVTIAEQDSAEFEVTTGGLATLAAAGVDPAIGIPALRARLRESTALVVSAPAGGIDVTTLVDTPLIVGDGQSLLAGTARPMQSAGSVNIRSTQGDVVVLDAPLAGLGRWRARAVSAENLGGNYLQNVPGVAAATLTGGVNGTLNAFVSGGTVFPGFGTNEATFRTRDLILLKDQTDLVQNGLYQVMSIGSASAPWQLRRVPGADTTADFAANTRIAITDGDSAGASFAVQGYANIRNTTPLRVSSGTQRAVDEVTVRFATSTSLDGSYSSATDEISGNAATLSIQGSDVVDGDLVLVRFGATDNENGDVPSNASNGVYQKSTNPVDGNWLLTRFINPETSSVVEEATVVVLDGPFGTALTGQTFSVFFDGLGVADLTIVEQTVETEIGSYDPRDSTTFVVSTSGDTSDSSGGLGKMLKLIQANAAQDLSLEDVTQRLQFGNVLGGITGTGGTISLRQELPAIDRPFDLESVTRYGLSTAPQVPIVIDGSRITVSRENTFVSRGQEVNGLEFRSGASTSLSPVPEEASIGRVSGLRLAGFEAGGAVVVDGASNLLIENMVIGLDDIGESKPVKYGIQVRGDSGEDGPVTLLNNSVFSASVFDFSSASPLTGAGVVVEGNSQHVQLVGGVVGGGDGSNTVGVLVKSSNDDTTQANSIGVNPVPLGYAIEVNTLANKATLQIPESYWEVIGKDLHLGQTVSGAGIATGSEIIAIKPTDREVILSERMLQTVTSQITLGTPGATFVTDNFFGVELQSGNIRMTNTDVANNVLDGVIVGSAVTDALWAQIGAGIALDSDGFPDSEVRSAASNAIFANGRYGIRFANGVTDTSPGGGRIAIEGNYIGTNISAGIGLLNGRSSYYWDVYGASDPEDAGSSFAAMLQQTADLSDDGRLDNSGNLNAELDTTVIGGGTGSRVSSVTPGVGGVDGGDDDDGWWNNLPTLR